MTEKQISETLKRVAPSRPVPDDVLAGALRRRAVTRRALVGGGLAAAAVAVAVPLGIDRWGRATPAHSGDPAAFMAGEVRGTVPAKDLPFDSTPGVDAAARVSEELAWDALHHGDSVNRVISPSCMMMSLVQAAEGAQGESLASIDAALGMTGDDRAAAFGALRQSLRPYDSLPKSVSVDDPPETPVVHQASNVVAIDIVVKQPFLDRVGEYFDATAEQVTYADAKPVLDEWVKKHTAGLIEQSSYDGDPDIRLVLQDALLFAAAWRTEFSDSAFADFEIDGGDPVGLDLMREVVEAPHAQGERWQAVRLAYDDALAADVILPSRGVHPLDLTTDELASATSGLAAAVVGPVEVSMPVLDWTGKLNLLRALPEINLEHLGGIIDGGFGAGWVQQVRLEVDRKGTVGAAVTEVVVWATSAGPEWPTFLVDRPYVFRVLDTRTGWPLFLCVIGDPTLKEDPS